MTVSYMYMYVSLFAANNYGLTYCLYNDTDLNTHQKWCKSGEKLMTESFQHIFVISKSFSCHTALSIYNALLFLGCKNDFHG